MPPDPLIGRVLGGFTVEALIGRGGMGRVYRAEQGKFGRKVALKVLAPELAEDPEFRERFLREAHLAATIEHPNILPVYDAGEEAGLLFIALRLVEGAEIDLGALLERDGALAPERALAILAQVASALDAAHARGLVHRDVKPGNVLLAGDHAYLTDFGIAKAVAGRREITRTGVFVGTLDYASPEQIRNEGLDGAADRYALGCLLFHCLTGHPPFDRQSAFAAMQAHLQDPPPSVSALRPELHPAIDAVIATALAKERDERYRSARHLIEAARAALRGAAAPTIIAPNAPVPRTVIEAVRPKRADLSATEAIAAHSLRRVWIIVGALIALMVGGGAVVAGLYVQSIPEEHVIGPDITPAVVAIVPTPSPTLTSRATSTLTPNPTQTATPTRATPSPTRSQPVVSVSGAVLSGRVSNTVGEPLAGVTARAWLGGDYPVDVESVATTDGAGEFSMQVRPGLRYWVSFVPPAGSGTAVTWYPRAYFPAEGTRVIVGDSGLRLETQLPRLSAVGGTVRDSVSGLPVGSVQVTALLARASTTNNWDTSQTPGTVSVTDSAGNFSLSLPPDSYVLKLWSVTGSFAQQNWTGFLTVDGEKSGLRVLVLRPSAPLVMPYPREAEGAIATILDGRDWLIELGKRRLIPDVQTRSILLTRNGGRYNSWSPADLDRVPRGSDVPALR